MNESAIRRLFAQLLAQKVLLNALIASHPEPTFLLKALKQYAESSETGLLNSSFPDEHIRQYEEELNSFISIIEKYVSLD